MAFPVNLDSAVPANSESPSLGAARIRALTQAIEDLFGLPNATNVTGAILSLGSLVDGKVATAPIIKGASPFMRMRGTEASAKDVRIIEDAGNVYLQVNTGSEGAPAWTSVWGWDMATAQTGTFLHTNTGARVYTFPDRSITVAGIDDFGGLATLTNKTGGALVAGDVVTVDTATASAVVLGDALASLNPFVVALDSIADNAAGRFAQSGKQTVRVSAATTIGHYLVKSATTLALQDSGIARAATVTPPDGTVGVALTSSGGAGTVVAELFGVTTAPTFVSPRHGRLVYVSGTSLKFAPFEGTKLPIKVGVVWSLRDIGTGITSGNPTTASNFVNGAASQTLAADTTYLVTVFDNAGTLTFDFLTTLTHAVDATTGVEIKNGDATRTVVGMIHTNATPNFTDFLTLSWFNRRARPQTTNFTSDHTTTSASYAELDTEIRNAFLTWGDEAVDVDASGVTSNANPGLNYTSVGFDGTSKENAMSVFQGSNSNEQGPIAISLRRSGLAEGYHYATLLGSTNGGTTGKWYGTAYILNTTVHLICSLAVTVRG